MPTLTRPRLTEVPLDSVLPRRDGLAYAAMNAAEWNAGLALAYRLGFVLLEWDGYLGTTKAYQRPTTTNQENEP